MATNRHLVLAFFPTEEDADRAAADLQAWAKTNPRARLEAVGVLVEDEEGNVKTHKLGPREARRGVGLGLVLGVVAAVASGGVTLLEGAVVGAAGGCAAGALFRKGLALSDADVARVRTHLDGGHAAVGVLAPQNQARAVSNELVELGGEASIHAVSPEAVAASAASGSPS